MKQNGSYMPNQMRDKGLPGDLTMFRERERENKRLPHKGTMFAKKRGSLSEPKRGSAAMPDFEQSRNIGSIEAK